MKFKLDKGKFPYKNFNKVLNKGKCCMNKNKPDVITEQRASDIYSVVQDMNSIHEVTMVMRKKKNCNENNKLI